MATATKEYTDQHVNVGSMRLHYLDWGNRGAPAMLLLHGGSQSAHSWDEFSRSMRDDYHVIALDQRGHGDSSWSKSGIYTAKAHLRDITGFVKALKLKEFVLVGLSMGGRNAFVYAATHPKTVRRLVIVDIGPETMKKGAEAIRKFIQRDVLPTFDAFVERAMKFNPRRPEAQIRERLSFNLRQLPDGRWSWKYDTRFRGRRRQEREDLWQYVYRIKAPTLLVRGAESDILAPAAAKRLQKAIPGSKLVTIENAGHTVAGDNPPAFAAAVQRFLKETGA